MAQTVLEVRQKRLIRLTVATVTRFRGIFFRVSDRGERRFLWFLTLIVGVGLCLFAVAGPNPLRLLLLLPGGFLVFLAWMRLRSLGRRRPRSQDVE